MPSADLMLMEPVMSPAFQLDVPSVATMPTSLYAQAAILYQQQSTGAIFFAISDGLRITLQ